MKRHQRLRWAFLGLFPLLFLACGQFITRAPETPTLWEAKATVTPRPTSTPAPGTPPPTFTPAPTPTPIIYVVQKGDTLLDIAYRFGVSLQALQEANAILDPRRLQIGQELIIPPREADERTPVPTPTPLPFQVTNLGFYESPTGSLWFLGEVWNTTGVDLEEAQVAVSLYDEKGKLLATDSAFAALNVVPRGERVPFAVFFPHPPPHFARYEVKPLAGMAVTYLGSRYLDLAITSHDLESMGPPLVVTGEVMNTGDHPARKVILLLTAYDKRGKVVGMRLMEQEGILAPGESRPFRLQLTPLGEVESYRVQVQGVRGP